MELIRRMLCALMVFATVSVTPVHATAYGTDQSDLWYIPSESGWGMQLVQQGNTIFATLFVYGPSGAPTWYVATMQPSTAPTWTGPLYATTGPWFALPFNSAVTVTQVGSMTWSGQFVESGTVSYTVNGAPVTKNVVRQVLVNDDYNGTFAGAIHGTVASCFNAVNNGTFEGYAAFAVTQNGTSVTLGYASSALGADCSFAGTYTQAGQFGKMVGNYSCTTGEVGTFNIFELNVGFNNLTGRITTNGTNNGCQTTGYLAGIRHR